MTANRTELSQTLPIDHANIPTNVSSDLTQPLNNCDTKYANTSAPENNACESSANSVDFVFASGSILGTFAANSLFLAGNYLLTDGKDIGMRFYPAAWTVAVSGGAMCMSVCRMSGANATNGILSGVIMAVVGAPVAAIDGGLSLIPNLPLWAAPLITTAAVVTATIACCNAGRLSFWCRGSGTTDASADQEKQPLTSSPRV